MSRKKSRSQRKKRKVAQSQEMPARQYSGLTLWGLVIVGIALAAFAIGPFIHFDLARQQADETDPTRNTVAARGADGEELPLDSGEPPLQFQPSWIDFGPVDPNTMHETTATVTNTGDRVLQILRAGASCPCTEIGLPARRRLDPGESMNIHVKMDSEARPGLKTVNGRIFVAGYESPAEFSVSVDVADLDG